MHTLTTGEFLYWLAVAVITVGSAGRITRLFTWDTFPPIVRIRMFYDKHTSDEWGLLLHCGYCFGFWAALGVVLWGYYTDWNTGWWIVNGVFAGAYGAAILMANDGDEGDG